jgi:hypothetical protein
VLPVGEVCCHWGWFAVNGGGVLSVGVVCCQCISSFHKTHRDTHELVPQCLTLHTCTLPYLTYTGASAGQTGMLRIVSQYVVLPASVLHHVQRYSPELATLDIVFSATHTGVGAGQHWQPLGAPQGPWDGCVRSGWQEAAQGPWARGGGHGRGRVLCWPWWR